MKKRAEPYPGSRMHVICPFCENACDKFTHLAWCAKCGVEYYNTRQGNIVFDTKRRNPDFAFAKAVQRAGGISLGKTTQIDVGAVCGNPAAES